MGNRGIDALNAQALRNKPNVKAARKKKRLERREERRARFLAGEGGNRRSRLIKGPIFRNIPPDSKNVLG